MPSRSTNHKPTRAEKRQHKKRRRMPISGKHVFKIQQIISGQTTKKRP